MDPYLALYPKMNAKWIKDLNIRPRTIPPLEENLREKQPHDVGLGNDFLDVAPKALTQANVDKLDYIKI